MRTLALRIAPLLLALVLVGCGGGTPINPQKVRQARIRSGVQPLANREPAPAGRARPGGAFSLTTSAFTNNAAIPKQYTADGGSLSPPLNWGAPPAGTKSLALIVSDPDAPGGNYIHWVVYAIPAAMQSLPGSSPKSRVLSGLGIEQGKNSAGTIGWTPPSPPPGKVHHYHFRLYALDVAANLTPGATATDVEKMAKGHTLGMAEIVGTYGR